MRAELASDRTVIACHLMRSCLLLARAVVWAISRSSNMSQRATLRMFPTIVRKLSSREFSKTCSSNVTLLRKCLKMTRLRTLPRIIFGRSISTRITTSYGTVARYPSDSSSRTLPCPRVRELLQQNTSELLNSSEKTQLWSRLDHISTTLRSRPGLSQQLFHATKSTT